MKTVNKTLGFLLGFAAIAVSGAAFAETKIATIRANDLVRESPLYKAAEAKMKSEFDKRQSELESTGKALAEDLKKYQRDGELMSPDERAKKEKDLSSRQVDFQYSQQKFREDAQTRDRELTQDLMSKVKDAIAQVAKQKGVDLVIQDPVFAIPSMDITDEVLKVLTASGGSVGDAKAKKSK
jgi:outer membrane protein